MYSAGQKFRTFIAMDFLWPPLERGATFAELLYKRSTPSKASSSKAIKKFPFNCAKILTKTVFRQSHGQKSSKSGSCPIDLTTGNFSGNWERVRLDSDWIVPTRWSWITQHPLVGQAQSWVWSLQKQAWQQLCFSMGTGGQIPALSSQTLSLANWKKTEKVFSQSQLTKLSY